jgi:hypothetical protein
MRHVDIRRRMEALVRRWPSSGETQSAFAARHHISRTKLRYWLRRTSGVHRPAAVAFAPVQVAASRDIGDEAVVEIVVSTGERVVVRAGASPEVLRMVLAVLRPC